MPTFRIRPVLIGCMLLVSSAFSSGCTAGREAVYVPPYVPRELNKRPLPEYVIEPPDVLQIDAIRLIPKGGYRIEALDTVLLRVTNTFPDAPIDGPYPVETDGTIDLGPAYSGKLKVVDLTLEEAKKAIEKQLSKHLKGHQVEIAANLSRAVQQVRGPHLVRPDGTVGLGTYGAVDVTGLTIAEAKLVIEARLSTHFLKPEVSVDVVAFNSKLYYVILDGAGYGEQVIRLPITGNETVLDAISQVNGLLSVSNKREIYVARPTDPEAGEDEVLPVDWVAICTKGQTATNYQLRPGDRVYVNSEHIVAFDTRLARLLSPIERLLGVSLLGYTTVQTFGGNGPFSNNFNNGN